MAKIKSISGCKAVQNHNERNQKKDMEHVKDEHTHLNQQLFGSKDIEKDVQSRLDELGITKIRKNGVLALEFVMTASPEYFGVDKEGYVPNPGSIEVVDFQYKALDFLEECFGVDNIVNAHLHMDEKTPHIHAICLPVVENYTKAKERRSNRKYEPYKLNASNWVDKKKQLSELQDIYARHMAPLGLKRGVKKERDTPEKYLDKASPVIEKAKAEMAAFEKESNEMVNEQMNVLNGVNEQIEAAREQGKKEMEDLNRQRFNYEKEIIALTDEFSKLNFNRKEELLKAKEKIEQIAHHNRALKALTSKGKNKGMRF